MKITEKLFYQWREICRKINTIEKVKLVRKLERVYKKLLIRRKFKILIVNSNTNRLGFIEIYGRNGNKTSKERCNIAELK